MIRNIKLLTTFIC